MNRVSFFLAALAAATLHAHAQPAQPSPAATSLPPKVAVSAKDLSEAEYEQVSRRILDRVAALRTTFPTVEGMKSPAHFEYNVTWVLDDPTQPHGKLNAKRAVFGKDGYWFSLQFYRGDWKGAAMFLPVEFGDLKLWFDYGHGGEASVIAAIAAIIKEENAAFRGRHGGAGQAR